MRASITLDAELLEHLGQAAATEAVSRSELVREMVADRLDRLAAGAPPTAGPAHVQDLIIRTPTTAPPPGTITTKVHGPGAAVMRPVRIEATEIDRFGRRLPPAVH